MLEKEIENQILDFLDHVPECFAWKNQNTGVYDPTRKAFRKSHSKHQFKGVSDILGVYKGKFLAIEVKQPKKKLTDHQQNFLDNIKLQGGIGFMATSVIDVIEGLDLNEDGRFS